VRSTGIVGFFDIVKFVQGFVSFVVILSVAPLVVDFLAFTRVANHESYSKVSSLFVRAMPTFKFALRWR
jgi:hypothetical protein